MVAAALASAALAFVLAMAGSPNPTTTALPTGAPRCIINAAAIMAKHGNPTQTLGFAIKAPASYTPGSTTAVPIQISGLTAFASGGILAYVNSTVNMNAGTAESHVGAFAATGNIRAQTASACTTANVNNENPTSTITHAAPLANTEIQTLMWTPPATDVGAVQVNVVVATGTVGQPWMILQSVMVASAGGGAGTTTTSAAAGGGATTTSSTTAAATTTTTTKATTTAAATTTTTTAAATTTAVATMGGAGATTTVSPVTNNAGAATTVTITVAQSINLVVVTAPAAAATGGAVAAGGGAAAGAGAATSSSSSSSSSSSAAATTTTKKHHHRR